MRRFARKCALDIESLHTRIWAENMDVNAVRYLCWKAALNDACESAYDFARGASCGAYMFSSEKYRVKDWPAWEKKTNRRLVAMIAAERKKQGM